RVDRHVLALEPQLQVASLQQCGELPVAVPQIQNDREGVVLLQVRDEEVQEEALAAAGRAQDQRVPHIVHVQAVGVGDLRRCLKHRERLGAEVPANGFTRISSKQEAQISENRLQ